MRFLQEDSLSRDVRRLLDLLNADDPFDCERAPITFACGRCWQCRVSKALKAVRATLADNDAKAEALEASINRLARRR
jgi:hypothetical protein